MFLRCLDRENITSATCDFEAAEIEIEIERKRERTFFCSFGIFKLFQTEKNINSFFALLNSMQREQETPACDFGAAERENISSSSIDFGLFGTETTSTTSSSI